MKRAFYIHTSKMRTMYLRFLFSFSFIHSDIFMSSKTIPETSWSLKRTHCPPNWHYFPTDESCLRFATSQRGDLSWNDSVNVCEMNSAQIFTPTDSNDLRLLEKKLEEQPTYVVHFQKGAWIGIASRNKSKLLELEINCFSCRLVYGRFL